MMSNTESAGQTSAATHVEQMHGNDSAARAAGVHLLEVSDGIAGVSMTVRPDMLNGHGTCHGGYLFLLADIAFSYACNTGGVLNVAAAADIHYVAPVAPAAVLTARAVRRIRFGSGERHGMYDVEVRDDKDVLVALFTGRAQQVGDRG